MSEAPALTSPLVRAALMRAWMGANWRWVSREYGFQSPAHARNVAWGKQAMLPTPARITDGERLHLWRRRYRMTQGQFGRLVGVSGTTVGRMERNDPRVRLQTWAQVMRFLHERSKDERG